MIFRDFYWFFYWFFWALAALSSLLLPWVAARSQAWLAPKTPASQFPKNHSLKVYPD